MINKRISAAALVFFFMLTYIWAKDGQMWGKAGLRVLQTEWFDIIYPPESEESAVMLFEKADGIYAEIAELYGREPKVKFPVVLCPGTEQFNAYYTSAPYNRIVLYDTAAPQDLLVFSEDLLSTFRHELTHAYTFNLKNGFWSWVGMIFGDCVSPASYMVSSGWAEGATLTSESSFGEGRLNSEYSKHMVKQAKLENEFPVFADVQGARDKYPAGGFYNFNGAFDLWLQQEYGMEKYAGFWYSLVNWLSLTPSLAFKKIYGCSLTEAWTKFYDSYEVPDIPSNPLGNGVSDFFDGSGKDWSRKNNCGSLYTSLASGGGSTAYIDSLSGSVFLNGKKIVCQPGADKISISNDGFFMALSYTDKSGPLYKKKVKIYDIQNRKWISVKGTGLSDASIICVSGKYYLVALGFESQKKWIEIHEFEINDKGRLCSLKYENKINLENGEILLSFTDTGKDNGQYMCIRRKGMKYTICERSLFEEKTEEYSLPFEGMTVTGLSFSSYSENLFFSWTKAGTLPRLGKLDLNTESFILYENDISGGIFTPVERETGRVSFEGHFYRQNRLIDVLEDSLSSGFMGAAGKETIILSGNSQVMDKEVSVPESKAYNPFKYMRGIFAPFSTLLSKNRDIFDTENFGTEIPCFLGATYATSNPWSSNILQVSGGIDPWSGIGGVSAGISGGTDTNLFKWNLLGQVEFKESQMKQAFLSVSESSILYTGNVSRIGIEGQAAAALVNTVEGSGMFSELSGVLDLWYSDVHKRGTGYFEYGGWTLGTEIGVTCVFYGDNSPVTDTKISPYLNIFIPKLIPIICPDSFSWNLPVVLRTKLYPGREYFLSERADVCLFAMEIQKSVPFFRVLYLNRLFINGGYDCQVKEAEYLLDLGNNAGFSDYIYLRATAGFAPSYYSSFYTEAFGEFDYKIRNREPGKPAWKFNFGISVSGLQ